MCKFLEGWKIVFLFVGLFIFKFMYLLVKFKIIKSSFLCNFIFLKRFFKMVLCENVNVGENYL